MKMKLSVTGLALLYSVTAFSQSYFDTTFTNYFRRTQGWTAGDATISIALPDGRNVWLFGDSYLNNYNSADSTLPCLFNVRNAVVVQEASNPDSMTTYIDDSASGIDQTYFKIGSVGNTVFWPAHGFVKDDTVFVFLQQLNGTTLAFLGNYIAKIQLPSFNLLSITLLPDMNGLFTGKSVLYDDSSGYYYIYCNKLNWIVYEPYVARAKFKDIVSGNWKFFNGVGWSANASLAAKISDAPVSPQYSVVKLKDQYCLITQDNGYLTCGLGRDIFSYQSNSPTGPFSLQRKLYTMQDQINGYYLLTYNAEAHPQFTVNDELLISYNVNDWVDTVPPDICPSQCKHVFTDRMKADSYRPKFVRVPFEMLGIKSASHLNQVEVNPNPVVSQLFAHVHASGERYCHISVVNKMGRVFMELFHQKLETGDNRIAINVSALPPDIYFLVTRAEDEDAATSGWQRKIFVKQ